MAHGASISSLPRSMEMLTKAVETMDVSRHENISPSRMLRGSSAVSLASWEE